MFWFEYIETNKQVQIPEEDIQIITINSRSIGFNVSFTSLDNPEAISLSSGTEQDLLVIQISKSMVVNDQKGESLILDKNDFDDEDGSNFYLSSPL